MTFAARLAAHFRNKPNQWLNGLELAGIAGAYAWRSRCSDLRKPPFNMAIENRQRKVGDSCRGTRSRRHGIAL